MSEWILKAIPDSLPANSFSLGAIRKFENNFYPIHEKAIFGRDEACCDYTLPWKHISRQHTEIKVVDDGLEVRDLASANGTYINGKRITVATAYPGDLIGFDKITLEVVGPNQALESPMMATEIEDLGNATVVRPISSFKSGSPGVQSSAKSKYLAKGNDKSGSSSTPKLKSKTLHLLKGMLAGLIIAVIAIALLTFIRS